LGYWNTDFATTTTTTTGGGQRRLRLQQGPISFFSTRCPREKNLLIPAAAGFFSLDATTGLLATRRRLGRRGNLFRHALSFCGVSCMYEEFTQKKNKKKRRGNGQWQWPTTQFLFGASAAGGHGGGDSTFIEPNPNPLFDDKKRAHGGEARGAEGRRTRSGAQRAVQQYRPRRHSGAMGRRDV